MAGFGSTVALPEIEVTPAEALIPGETAAVTGADIAGAGAAGLGAGGLGAAGLAGLVALPAIGPGLLEFLVGGGGTATPAQIAANTAALGGVPGISAAAQAQGLSTRGGALSGFISPAQAAGTLPSTVVGQEFGQLPGGGTAPATPISAVAGFQPGGAPLPTPRPTNIAGIAGAGGPTGPAAAPSTVNLPSDVAAAPGTPGTAPTTGQPDLGYAQYSEGAPVGVRGVAPFAETSTGGIGGFFKNNAGLLSLLGLGVGGQLLSPAISKGLGLNKVPGSENLTGVAQTEANIAGGQAATGAALEQPLATGVLPAAQQTALDKATNDAIGTIRGKYALLGMSGSTSEMSAIDDVKQRAATQQVQMETELFNAGNTALATAQSALGLEESIYSTLLQTQLAQDQQLGNAISGFANALALGTAIKGIPSLTA